MSGPSEYVEQTAEGGWRVAGTRVSLDSVVHLFLNGASPEETVSQFPALTLEQAYGVVAFYLGRQHEIDRYLASQEQWSQEQDREQARRSDPLLDRLRRARKAAGKSRKTA